MLRLAVRGGDEERYFELPTEDVTLGSSVEAELCVPFRGVSRRHARVCRHGNGVRIVDNGSKNGLVRDGTRLEEVVLAAGDSISLGDAVLTLEEISTADGELAIVGAARQVPAGDESTAQPPPEPARAERTLVFPPEFVTGESESMRHLCAQIGATVRSHLDVLLLGETGTGKELFARMIHASGPTAKGPFVAINCAAIPAELLEAQLFGVEARVATGVDPRVGLFVKAEGGSIFLDEIGELPQPLQPKLLRVLQEREVLAVGAHAPRRIRLRVISASNRELEREVRHARFRADLYYRLRGLQFHLPPLRHRREDIPALVARFVAQSAAEHDKHLAGVSRKALDLLRAYAWPGNVRELRSEIDRAVLLADDGATLTSEHFGGVRWHLERMGKESGEVAIARGSQPIDALPAASENPYDLAAARDAVERRLIREALAETGGNQSRAAKLLGVTRNGLALKAKRLGIPIGRS